MKKNNLKQQAYQIILNKIINCEYAPGTLLNENLLLEAVPGSRTPIRDAISRLEQEHLVTILPKKGILVSSISSNSILHIYDTRLLWEPYAVLHYGNTLSSDFYMNYYRLFSESNSSDKNFDVYQIDFDFHNTFIEATRNPFIMRTYEQTNTQNQRSRILIGNTTKFRLAESRQEHLDLLIACLEKNWTAASEKMRIHLEASKISTIQELVLKL